MMPVQGAEDCALTLACGLLAHADYLRVNGLRLWQVLHSLANVCPYRGEFRYPRVFLLHPRTYIAATSQALAVLD